MIVHLALLAVANPIKPLETLLRSILDFFHNSVGPARGRGRSSR